MNAGCLLGGPPLHHPKMDIFKDHGKCYVDKAINYTKENRIFYFS